MTTELHDVFPGRLAVRKAQQIARRALSLSSAIAVASTLLVGVSMSTAMVGASADDTTVTATTEPAPLATPAAVPTPSAKVLSGREQALQRASRAGLTAGSFRSKAYGIAYAREWSAFAHKWNERELTCLTKLWQGESSWRWNAKNRRTGAYGIPQALPARKMASAGKDWKTNPETQIRWGLQYIASRHLTPCKALAVKAKRGWY